MSPDPEDYIKTRRRQARRPKPLLIEDILATILQPFQLLVVFDPVIPLGHELAAASIAP